MNKLTQEQKALFDALHEDKVQDYKVFSKRDYGRLFSSLIDKYPETAHFVYELLQNAEDANASYVSILLKTDCLIFKHNGSKHFDVTPIDSDSSVVGDINSITVLHRQLRKNELGGGGADIQPHAQQFSHG